MGTSMAHLPYKPRTIYRDLLPPDEKKPKKIVSVWPEAVVIPSNANGGTHVIIPGTLEPGARDHGRWNFVLVGSGVERDDMGEVKTLALRSISARRNAMDVIGLSDEGRDEVTGAVLCPAVKTSQLFERGYFVPDGDEPTEDELMAAERRREKFLDVALASGDRAWGSTKDYDKIPGEALIAARIRNISNRDWARGKTGEDNQECPACGGQMKRGKPLCPVCKETIVYEPSGRAFWPKDPNRLKAAVKG